MSIYIYSSIINKSSGFITNIIGTVLYFFNRFSLSKVEAFITFYIYAMIVIIIYKIGLSIFRAIKRTLGITEKRTIGWVSNTNKKIEEYFAKIDSFINSIVVKTTFIVLFYIISCFLMLFFSKKYGYEPFFRLSRNFYNIFYLILIGICCVYVSGSNLQLLKNNKSTWREYVLIEMGFYLEMVMFQPLDASDLLAFSLYQPIVIIIIYLLAGSVSKIKLSSENND